MDAVLSILVLLALAAPVGLAAAWFSTNGAEALSTLFRPDRGLGWPHGVQEEEPTAWNWDRPTGLQLRDPRADAAESLNLEPVAFQLRAGSARDRRRWR